MAGTPDKAPKINKNPLVFVPIWFVCFVLGLFVARCLHNYVLVLFSSFFFIFDGFICFVVCGLNEKKKNKYPSGISNENAKTFPQCIHIYAIYCIS